MKNLGLWPTNAENIKKPQFRKRKKEAGNDQDSFNSDDSDTYNKNID